MSPLASACESPAYDLLVFTIAGTAGKDYDALCEALTALPGRASQRIFAPATRNNATASASSMHRRYGASTGLMAACSG